MNTPQLSIDRQSQSLWMVTFDNPPINLIDIQTIRELSSLLDEMEHNEDLKWSCSAAPIRNTFSALGSSFRQGRGCSPAQGIDWSSAMGRCSDQAFESTCDFYCRYPWTGAWSRKRIRAGLRYAVR
jgi:hypothetical protein